jgi:hypothetical protein
MCPRIIHVPLFARFTSVVEQTGIPQQPFA